MTIPITVLEAIQRGTEFLTRKGVESPRLQAELLLAHVLKIPRMRLYLDFERLLAEEDLVTLRELIRRRGQREPLQQIVGSTSFCGLELAVNRHVLVPRPETELLAELGWEVLARVQGTAGPPILLDWGTGSGCLSISLAVHCPAAQITAVDSSLEALTVARANAATHNVADRIEFRQGEDLTVLPPSFKCDLFITNPPYIPTGEIEHLEPEVRDFEPRLALDGGVDGLDWPRRIASCFAGLLRADGRLLLEFGDGQAEAVRRIFEEQNWIVEAVREDYTRRPRILVARLG